MSGGTGSGSTRREPYTSVRNALLCNGLSARGDCLRSSVNSRQTGYAPTYQSPMLLDEARDVKAAGISRLGFLVAFVMALAVALSPGASAIQNPPHGHWVKDILGQWQLHCDP